MRIGGLMKMTLLDFPGRVACTIFLSGCNFRCPFCHNGSLARGEGGELSPEELFAYLKKRQGILDGVCVSGGEPLIHKDVGALIKEIRALGYAVKLDTNGSFPNQLSGLLDEGLLDYIAMDVKSSECGYFAAAGVGAEIEKIKQSIDLIRSSGVAHEFRTTVVKGLHTPDSIAEAARLVGAGEPYFLQPYKLSDDVIAPSGLSEFSNDELDELLAAALTVNPRSALRGV